MPQYASTKRRLIESHLSHCMGVEGAMESQGYFGVSELLPQHTHRQPINHSVSRNNRIVTLAGVYAVVFVM